MAKYASLVGMRFNRLTVIERLGPDQSRRMRWLCICDCGAEVNTTSSQLNKGIISCGCFQREQLSKRMRDSYDLVGKKFGRLTVLREGSGGITANGKSYRTWVCSCVCGKTVENNTNVLNSGRKSCGCINLLPDPRGTKEERQDKKLARAVDQVRRRAHERGHEWCLSTGQVLDLFSRSCFYCKAAPRVYSHSHGGSVRNGIDRLDNSRGYVLDNCVPCCTHCNTMKHAYSYDEFVSRILAIYDGLDLRITHKKVS